MSNLQSILKYLRYRLSAFTSYDVHSPFVFHFINDVLKDDRYFTAFEEIEFIRRQLYADKSIIHVDDFGAGSKKIKSSDRSVSDIAKANLIAPKFGQLLFRIVNYRQPKHILELGTSLGISTLYLSKANLSSSVITLEGSNSIANIANNIFKKVNAQNIQLITGEFSSSLPGALEKLKTVDLAFIDGNHRKEATLHYFNEILEYTTERSILIFDDIHWSNEMEKAWREIKRHKRVRLSVDLFYKGLIFFNHDFHEPQHFTLKY